MKRNKIIALFSMLLFGTVSFAQTSASYGTNSIVGNQKDGSYVIDGGNITQTMNERYPAIEMYGTNGSVNKGMMNFLAGNSINGIDWRTFTFSKYDGTNWPTLLTIARDGRLGIGSFVNDWDLRAKFQIGLDHKMIAMDGFTEPTFNGNSYIGFNAVKEKDGNSILTNGNGTGSNGGALIFGTMTGGLNFATIKSTSGNAMWTQATDFMNNNIRMSIRPDGKVVIGNPAGINTGGTYTLYVPLGIRTESVKVDLRSSWADFVFDKNYKLRTLESVETFIKENKHLPEIPSAEEVRKEGVDLIEMDTKLLQKIEELTLYMIEMKKENDTLKKKVEVLEERLK